jgi:hypothetical protein
MMQLALVIGVFVVSILRVIRMVLARRSMRRILVETLVTMSKRVAMLSIRTIILIVVNVILCLRGRRHKDEAKRHKQRDTQDNRS